MIILGIESSCDETGAALVSDGRYILSNVIASQAALHDTYGGVVPEVASRQQLTLILPTIESAMQQAGAQWSDLDAIAVTRGPGLAGSLLIGLSVAKALSFAHTLPLIGINHLEAHIYANWLRQTGAEEAEAPAVAGNLEEREDFETIETDIRPGDPKFPLLCLVVSGAHTELVLMNRHSTYQLLGRTRDDAAGEAFDKVARILGLGYPGGPAIQKVAQQRTSLSRPYQLPRAWMRGTYDFSFSGLKTAVRTLIEGTQHNKAFQPGEASLSRPVSPKKSLAAPADSQRQLSVPEIAAEFQAAVVEVLVAKTKQAAEEFDVAEVLLAGGVAANAELRRQMSAQLAVPVSYPSPDLCTDNAVMIASAGYFHFREGQRDDFSLEVDPGLTLPFIPN